MARHDGQRCGSLVNPLLAKKACSPAEKLNSSAQSRPSDRRKTDNGKPGPRGDYGPDYYAAFVMDPDGYRIEAYCSAQS